MMEPTVINLDKFSDNFISDINGNRVSMLDLSNKNLVIHLGDKRYGVSSVRNLYGGLPFIEDNGDRVYLNDGYNDILIRSGYIVLDDYDERQIDNTQFGKFTRKFIMDSIKRAVGEVLDKGAAFSGALDNDDRPECVIARFQDGISNIQMYDYTAKFFTIDKIVRLNESRKINNLPYYSFLRNMDRYGCIYFMCFAKLKYEYTEEMASIMTKNSPTSVSSLFVSKLIEEMNYNSGDNTYHFVPLSNKPRNLIINSTRNDI